MRVPLPAGHPLVGRAGPDGREATAYSHYDDYEEPVPVKRSRRAPWLTVVAVVAAFALLFAYHEELRRALSAAEDDLREGTGAIALESGRALKQKLRDITTRLSESDRDQLGALVDAVTQKSGGGSSSSSSGSSDDVTRQVGQAMDDAASFGFGTQSATAFECDQACMDALASKLPKKVNRGSRRDNPVSGMGKYDVGDELQYRRDKKVSEKLLKGAFMKSQVRKMDEAVKRGWSDLKKGETSDAREDLKEAKEFHNSELRLMRGSPNIAQYLSTPTEIRKLRDGIDEARGNIERTPGRLSKIIDQPLPKSSHRRSGRSARTRGRGIPKKLEAIMDKQFTAADDNVKRHALTRISHHFRGGREGGDSSSAWTSGGTSEVTLPRSSSSQRHHESELNGDFNMLAQQAIERGRAAVNDGLYQDARKALSKAKVFLSSIKDAHARKRREARRHGDDAQSGSDVREMAKVDKLELEYSILEHAVTNLKEQRRRAERKQLQQNLRVLHAPIQRESMTDYASNGKREEKSNTNTNNGEYAAGKGFRTGGNFQRHASY